MRHYLALSLLLLLPCVPASHAQSTDDPSLADRLAQAPRLAGDASAKYATPFLVTRVVPKPEGSDTCSVEVVTNGMSYELFADGLAACRHLPALHAVEWGCVISRLKMDAVELVFTRPEERAKVDTYFVRRSVRIPSDWTEDQ